MDDRDAVTTELGATWFGAGLSLHARARLAAAATLQERPPDTILLRARRPPRGSNGRRLDVAPLGLACERLSSRQVARLAASTEAALARANVASWTT